MPENSFTNEQVKILEDQFRKDKYIRGKELMGRLATATGLEPGQIRPWFSSKRQKTKKAALLMAKEGKIAELEALLNAKDAEIGSLRGQIAALRQQTDDNTIATLVRILDEIDAEQVPPAHASLSSAGEPSQLGL